jgi:hypothetical protein
MDGHLAIEAKEDQAIERVGLGVRLLGEAAVNDGQDIAGVDQLQSPLDALGLDIGVVVGFP